MELVIVTVVVIILASSVLMGTGQVMRNLRFGNAFNKMVFMVQQARNAAITSKGDFDYYGVEFAMPNIKTVGRFAEKTGVLQKTYVENLIIEESVNSNILIKDKTNNPAGVDCGTGIVKFEKKTAQVSFICTNLLASKPTLMEFGLKEKAEVQGPKTKSFAIHMQSGVPQIQQ